MKVVMGRKLDICSKENLGTEEVTSIKPMYLLLMLLKTWGSSVKTLPRKIILLKSDGQEATWIEITVIQSRRTYCRKDKKQKCGVCKPLQWHNMLRISKKVRSVNLQCDQGIMVKGMSLIGVIDSAPL